MKTFNTLIQSAVAIALLTSMSATSQAADAAAGTVEPAKKVVQYGDLKQNAAGAELLYHRIVIAAQQVCGDRNGPRPAQETVRVQMCVEQSVERAVKTVDQPALTAVLAAKTGHASVPSTVFANRR